MICGIDIVMFIIVGVDGCLYSCLLGIQEVEFDGDLWFVIVVDSLKVVEIVLNLWVNVVYVFILGNIYVLVVGIVWVIDDCVKVEELWLSVMKLFFFGGLDDLNLCLIYVSVELVEYWDGLGGLLGSVLSFVLLVMNDELGVLFDNGVVDLC